MGFDMTPDGCPSIAMPALQSVKEPEGLTHLFRDGLSLPGVCVVEPPTEVRELSDSFGSAPPIKHVPIDATTVHMPTAISQ